MKPLRRIAGSLGLAALVFLIPDVGSTSTCAPNALLSQLQLLDVHRPVSDVTTADLNEDGAQDIVAVGSGGISVLFGGATPSPGPTHPALGVRITCVDWNGDGHLDALLAKGDQSFSLLPGNGNGTFGAEQTYFITGQEIVVLVASSDYDGDGTADLAVVSTGTDYYNNNFFVRLWTRTDGIYSRMPGAQVYSVNHFRVPSPDAIASDIDGDGRLDIVLASSSGGASVLSATGGLVNDSWMRESLVYMADRFICPAPDVYYDFRLSVADLNSDGVRDITFLNRCSRTVSAAIADSPVGASGPTFSNRLLGSARAQSELLATGDLDADGAGDVLLFGNGGFVRCLVTDNLQGDALLAVDSTTVGLSVRPMLADVTSDGLKDLIVGRAASLGIAFAPGACSSPSPEIAAVSDVPHDQGGSVRVAWNASGADRAPSSLVAEYWVWRSQPVVEARSAGHPIRDLRAVTSTDREGLFWSDEPALSGYFWEWVAASPATGLSAYSMTCATGGDSVEAGNPHTAFFVQARSAGSNWVWSSPPDSGYSVDNLSPPAPANFTASLETGAISLRWSPSLAPDVRSYWLYRGSSPDFPTTSGYRIGVVTDTSYRDASGHVSHFYKLQAEDIHGNRGRFALLSGQQPTATVATLLLAEQHGDRVALRWYVSDESPADFAAHRSVDDEPWTKVSDASPDPLGVIAFDDVNVEPGHTYEYRLGVRRSGEVEAFFGHAFVRIEVGVVRANGFVPSPVVGGSVHAFVEARRGENVRVELLDLAGRVLAVRWAAGSDAREAVRLTEPGALPPGVYFVRMHLDRPMVARVAVLQ